MAVFVYPMGGVQQQRELFALSDEESSLLSEACLYPSFGCRIDNYGKTFLYPIHIQAILEFLNQTIKNKEKQYCYDREYEKYRSLWERFMTVPPDASIVLLGD